MRQARPPRLHRQSLGSQIAAALRQDILLGRRAPGTAISQQSLCEDFGTSRMPVRDALRKLTHEGLITTTATGHSVVSELTGEDILDAFLIESIVHGRAARRAAGKAAPADLRRLGELQAELEQAAAGGDLAHAVDLNWLFHKEINLLAGSAKLLGLLRTASVSIPRDYLLAMPDWVERSNREHAAILAAFAQGDADAAEELMREHVVAAGANLVAYLLGKGVLH
jgi:DNA-binding GntR family transcriptional regulator